MQKSVNSAPKKTLIYVSRVLDVQACEKTSGLPKIDFLTKFPNLLIS